MESDKVKKINGEEYVWKHQHYHFMEFRTTDIKEKETVEYHDHLFSELTSY